MNNKILISNSKYTKREFYPSNNDGSIKNIAFLLENENDVIFDGEGKTFEFEDGVSPFVLNGCKNIVLRNFNIDYKHPQHLEGEVVLVEDRRFLLKPLEGFKFSVEDGIFKCLTGSENSLHGRIFCQEFDPVRKAPYANTGYMYIQCVTNENGYDEKETFVTPARLSVLGDCVEFRLIDGYNGKFNVHLGGRLVIMIKDRQCSGIFINDCQNVKVENVNIYRSPSMGVICQLSENVSLYNVNVGVKTDRLDMLSSNADATHFVNCKGKVTLTNCSFYNMLDDGCNIHGIYGKVVNLGENSISVRLMHGQQKGVNYLQKGDKIVFLSSEDYSQKASAIVEKSQLSEDKCYIDVFLKDVDGHISEGLVVDNITAMPEVYIAKCKTGNNRPRGFLLTSVKPMLVEDCLFENMACGIHVTSDARDWFESGKVTDLTIRNNEFRGCNYAWGTAAIVIDPSCEKDGVYVHKNVTVENNVLNTFGYGLLWAKSVDGLVVKGNSSNMIYSDRVPEVKVPTLFITNCKNVAIS